MLGLSTLIPIFGIFSTSGVSLGSAFEVYALIVPIFVFTFFLVLGVTNEFLFGWIFNVFFCCVHLLEFLWVYLLNRQHWRLCLGELTI